MCSYKTHYKKIYDQHIKSHHKCGVCEIFFHGTNAIRNFKNHLKSHEAKIQYLCSKCGKEFLSQPFLNRHTKKKHGPKQGDIEIQLDSDSPDFQPEIPQDESLQSKIWQNSKVVKTEVSIETGSRTLNHALDMSFENLSQADKDPLNQVNDPKKKQRKQNLKERHYMT